MILENVAKGLHVEDAKYLSAHFYDIIYPKQESDETADDIIKRISDKLEKL